MTRLGADGVVVSTMEMRVRDRECAMLEHRKVHIVECSIRARPPRTSASRHRLARGSSLAILSLDPQRRQAARVNLGTGMR